MNYSAPVPLTDWERGRWVSVSKCAAKKGGAISKRCFLGRFPGGRAGGHLIPSNPNPLKSPKVRSCFGFQNFSFVTTWAAAQFFTTAMCSWRTSSLSWIHPVHPSNSLIAFE